MRVESSRYIEHFGSVRINGVQRVLELDSGAGGEVYPEEAMGARKIGRDTIEDIEHRMAIVILIKNEELKIFEGVISAIPHECLMIVVSNSQRKRVDAFKMEHDILSRFCRFTRRQALIIHQKDAILAEALKQANYTEILDEKGLVRDGKSEGMVIGILLAMSQGKDYVGFVDADNYIPGAVWEYVKHYAAGFSLAKSPYAMVRVLWRYKPKISRGLYFKKWGRVSEVTNRCLNSLISTNKGFETDIIKTANAGEHAMSIGLAKMLTYGSCYAIETQELVSILEQFGGVLPITNHAAAEQGIEVIQTESINPHLHKDKGEKHLLHELLLPSLSVIYHSPLCNLPTKRLILDQLVTRECLKSDEEPPKVHIIPPPQEANIQEFSHSFEGHLRKYVVPEEGGFREQFIGTEFGRTAAKVRRVVFTDLDGTLLHPLTYSYTQALDALRLLQDKEIPIIFCSAKTRAEQEVYREELGINDPFIVENGGAIFIPKDYFSFSFAYDKVTQDYLVIELGTPYTKVRQKLKKAEEESGCRIIGFGDLSVEEVAQRTGLNLKFAELAKQREYDETFEIGADKIKMQSVLNKIEEVGLSYVHGGRFYDAMGGNDKGKAVKILAELFKQKFGEIRSIGIGDSSNDMPMLAVVDIPLLVQRPGNRWEELEIANIYHVRGVGPEGWSEAVKELVAGL